MFISTEFERWSNVLVLQPSYQSEESETGGSSIPPSEMLTGVSIQVRFAMADYVSVS